MKAQKSVIVIISLIVFLVLILIFFNYIQIITKSNIKYEIPELPIAGKKWTFMFYMIASSDLAKDYLADILELSKGTLANEDMNIVVLIDQGDRGFNRQADIVINGTKLLYVQGEYKDIISNPLYVDIPYRVEKKRFEELVFDNLAQEDRDFVLSYYSENDKIYLLDPYSSKNNKEKLLEILKDKAGYLLPITENVKTDLNASDGAVLRKFVSYVILPFNILTAITGYCNSR